MSGLMPSITIERPTPIGGRFAFVDYGVEAEPWHERYLFEVLDGTRVVIITPDEDVYVEDFRVGPGHFRTLRLLPPRGRSVPRGLGVTHDQPVYRFKSHLILPRTMAKAQKLYDAEKKKLERPSRPPDAEVPDEDEEEEEEEDEEDEDEPAFDADAADKAIKRPGGQWIVIGCSDASKVGKPADFSGDLAFARFDGNLGYVVGTDGLVQSVEFSLDADFGKYVRARKKAWAEADPNATPTDDDDARTLPILWSANGYRVRGFAEASRLMEVSEMDEKDFPLEGPRSSSWFLTAMANAGTTPLSRHGKWVTESGVGADSRSSHEHSILSHVLEKAITVDQLNVVNLVALEIVVRRLILLEEAHSVDAGAPSFEGWEHWL